MARGKVKVLKANGTSIIMELTVGKGYRFTIPNSIRSLLKPEEKVKITIEKALKEKSKGA